LLPCWYALMVNVNVSDAFAITVIPSAATSAKLVFGGIIFMESVQRGAVAPPIHGLQQPLVSLQLHSYNCGHLFLMPYMFMTLIYIG